MFDFVHNRKRWVQIILIIITIPFALWGVESYRTSGGGGGIASVGSYDISQEEFQLALREQQDRMMRMLGGNFDPAMLENTDFKQSVLDNLVQERLVLNEAGRIRMVVPDAQLAAIIQQVPAFHEDGKFSSQHYEKVLRAQGLTPIGFESRVRHELLVQQVSDAFVQSGFAPKSTVSRLIAINEQQREVSVSQVAPENFLPQVKLSDDTVAKYYEEHRNEFQIPEQVRIQYVVLSPDALASQVEVSAEEVKKDYEAHSAKYAQPEERRASHILITVDAKAPADQKKAAREKAEGILREAKQVPGKFAELAKKYSQDPGSSGNGGDLGFFGQGSMVKPFEDAVFAMQTGEIRGPVETDFGFHIIKLESIKPAKVSPFEEVREKIEQELRKQKAQKIFVDHAEQFSNLVYEQSDSLKAVSEQLKLKIQESPWISRSGNEVIFPATGKMLEAIFSDEVLKQKRNTEAIEIQPNVLASARIVEHKPSSTRPFDEVKADITKNLMLQQAKDLAVKAGKEKLANLQGGKESGVQWSAARMITRQQSFGLSPAIISQVYKTNPDKLPAYIGVEDSQGGYTLVRVTRIVDAPEGDPQKQRAYTQQLRQMLAQEEMAAYLNELRKESKIKVRRELLEKKQ